MSQQIPPPQPLPAPVSVQPPQNAAPAEASPEPKKKYNRVNLKTSYVHVVIGVAGKDGKIHETVHSIDSDEFSISEVFTHEKAVKAKVKDDEGRMIGFEPTGEQELTLKVKYHLP